MTLNFQINNERLATIGYYYPVLFEAASFVAT